jgi:predicted nucleic acid-binding protein
MVPDDLRGRTVLLDACCLINVFASGRIEDILSALPAHFAVVEKVMEEALYVLPERQAEGEAAERESLNVESLVDAGLVTLARPESEDEENAYINLAADLDDGEAMTCALAILRHCDVATDERKAIRILRERGAQVAVHTTPSLIRAWAVLSNTDRRIVRAVLQSIETRGRFRPGSHDSLRWWWEESLHHV